MFQLTGKNALVTGAASGIGRAIAETFARQGATVWVVDRDEANGVEVVAAIRATGGVAEFAALDLDVAVVAAYGLILPQTILDAPKHGCLNVHGSLLPRWRGAAPVQRAILAGDRTTGVMVMQMEAGLDTGPVRATTEIEIGNRTTGELTSELAELGAELMVIVLQDMAAHPAVAQPEEGVTYAAKIDKVETRIDFTQSAEQVERQIRAFNPAPGAWFEYESERYRILSAHILPAEPHHAGEVLDSQLTIACTTGAIRPMLIQRAGKPAMATQEFLRGKPIPQGTILS
jgi:methionyl-tRNA formyltransferase